MDAPLNDGPERLRHSGAAGQRVCLCSSDEVYAREAVETAKLFRDAGCAQICLAGRPGDLEEALREAGVQTFIYAGGNVLTVLSELYAGQT